MFDTYTNIPPECSTHFDLRLMIESIYGEAKAYLDNGNYEHIERLRAIFQEMPGWFKEEEDENNTWKA